MAGYFCTILKALKIEAYSIANHLIENGLKDDVAQQPAYPSFLFELRARDGCVAVHCDALNFYCRCRVSA